MPAPSRSRLAVLVCLALIAFAANSLLCRLALRETGIDPASFTLVRIVSGAVVLALLLRSRGQRVRGAGDTVSALALFAYAAAFSYAYVWLPTGTGALLLFGTVQVTMITAGWRGGARMSGLQWAGLGLALAGLLILLLPGATAPDPGAAALMILAGTAWGVYSLRGGGAGDPLRATAGNFLRALPAAFLLALVALPWLRWDGTGVAYAVVSGAVTSGLGYAVWYHALRGLDAARAATVQLATPVLAALMGLAVLLEPVDLHFALAAAAVLSGIAVVIHRPRLAHR